MVPQSQNPNMPVRLPPQSMNYPMPMSEYPMNPQNSQNSMGYGYMGGNQGNQSQGGQNSNYYGQQYDYYGHYGNYGYNMHPPVLFLHFFAFFVFCDLYFRSHLKCDFVWI